VLKSACRADEEYAGMEVMDVGSRWDVVERVWSNSWINLSRASV
jgi:hypothetical protein